MVVVDERLCARYVGICCSYLYIHANTNTLPLAIVGRRLRAYRLRTIQNPRHLSCTSQNACVGKWSSPKSKTFPLSLPLPAHPLALTRLTHIAETVTSENAESYEKLKMLRIVKPLRIFKLLRLLKASRSKASSPFALSLSCVYARAFLSLPVYSSCIPLLAFHLCPRK